MDEEKTKDKLREYIEGVNDFSEEYRIKLRDSVERTYASISESLDYSG